MNKSTTWLLATVFSGAACIAAAQGSKPPLVNQTFKNDDGGWVSSGIAAKLAVSHDPGIAEPTAGALKFNYTVAKGDLNVMYLPVPLGSWTAAKSIKFRVRTDSQTMLAIALQEQDGGRYVAMIQAPKDRWQSVELSTSDFILAQEKDDPKDPDGKLDMDRVAGIAISDMSQFLVATDNAMLQELFGVTKGSHAMYIDSFTVGVDVLPAGSASIGTDVQLETFVHPQLAWIGLGGMRMSQSSGLPLVGPALKADYHIAPGKVALITKQLPTWILTGSKVLSFDIACTQPSHFIVQLEQYDGGKYNMMIETPGGSIPQHKKLLLSGFARGDDSTDKDTKLHLALIKSFLIIDASGMIDQAEHDNTIWLNHIVASTN